MLELFFVSATSSVLPISTEPTLTLLLGDNVSPLIILIVLIHASVLGALIGYLLGKYGIRRTIPFHNSEREARIRGWFGKYGAALLMFSPWTPFADDLVLIVAGVEVFNRSTFLLNIFVAKAFKGTVIVYFLSFFVQLVGLHL